MKRFLCTIFLCFLMLAMFSTPGLAASSVKVRAGIHDRFNRLVFDWNDPTVKYTLSQQNGHVVVQFDRSVTANLGHVQQVEPPFIRNITQSSTAKGLQVAFDVPNNTRVQGFKVERNLAFDVLLLKKGALDFTPTKTETNNEPDTSAQQKQTTDINPEAAADNQEPPAPKEPETAKETPKPEPEAQPKTAEPTPATTEPAPEEKPAAPAKLAGQIDVPVLPPSDLMQPKETRIQLHPTTETRLALWQRGHKLWLVINKPVAEVPLSVQGYLAASLSYPWQFNSQPAGNTAYVFDLPIDQKTYIKFKRVSNRWDIILSPNVITSAKTGPAAMVVQTQNGVLSLYAGDQPTVAQFTDPWLGDQLAFVPVRRPESRLITQRSFAVFQLPQTILGAVVVSLQNLALTPVLDKIDINLQGQQSLGFSDTQDQALATQNAAPTVAANINNNEDFVLWPWPHLQKPEDITHSRQFLEAQIMATTTPEEKAGGYTKLARYLLGQQRGLEASGILRLAAQQKADLSQNVSYRALAGIEAAMRAQTILAAEFFNHPQIMSQSAAHLWLGYAMALNENWRQARQAFSQSQAAASGRNPLASLSPAWHVPMILAMAEADLMSQDLSMAQQRLNKLPKNAVLTASQQAAKDYLISAIQQAAQQPKRSQQTLEKLKNGPDQLYRIKAQLILIERQRKDTGFDPKPAIEALEKMRYSWRGDQLEIRVLELLGQLYIGNKRYFDGLTTWREAASIATDQADTDRLATQMGRVFADLFVAKKADDISALQALALYERFKELTPTGQDGVAAQRYLAKRLQRVDLLDQADALLQGVLQQQPLGAVSAEIGAELAQVRIKNRQPDKALKALDDSTPQAADNGTAEALPKDLQEKRYFLRARALADAGKRDDALSMLADATSEQGLSLRADLLWAAGRWDMAAAELGKLLALYPTATQSAEKDIMARRADVVLRQAIALTLAGDQMGLVTLTQTEQDFMVGTQHAQSFKVITQGGSNGKLADLPTLQKYLNDVNLFEKFLQSENKARQPTAEDESA